MGDSLPQVGPDEMLLQKSPTVFQRADADGNWSRETDAGIVEKSVSRRVEAMESATSLARETKKISEHSNVEVDGASTLEVGTQLTMLAGKRADLGTLGQMNLTAGGDSSHSTGKNAAETVGGNHSSRVKKDRDVTVEGKRKEDIAKDQTLDVGGKMTDTIKGEKKVDVGGAHTDTAAGDRLIEAANITLRAKGRFTIVSESGEGGGVNLYQELLSCLQDIREALDVLATHDHPDAGVINQGGAVAAESASAEGHRQKMKGITG